MERKKGPLVALRALSLSGYSLRAESALVGAAQCSQSVCTVHGCAPKPSNVISDSNKKDGSPDSLQDKSRTCIENEERFQTLLTMYLKTTGGMPNDGVYMRFLIIHETPNKDGMMINCRDSCENMTLLARMQERAI